jgi:hypothetical protein
MIRVSFSDKHESEIPLADLVAVCGVGSHYAIRLPVASKVTFDHFQTFVNKHKPPARDPGWDDYIMDWEDKFIEQFKDKNQLNDLAAVIFVLLPYVIYFTCIN